MRPHVLSLMVVALAASVAACGDDSAPAATIALTTAPATVAPSTTAPVTTAPVTTAAPTTAAPTTAAPATSAAAASGNVAGSWVADAGAVIAANTANIGGAGAISCTGPLTLTFAGGQVSLRGEYSCTAPGGLTGTGSVTSTGQYRVSGSTLVVTGATTNAVVRIAGTEVPIGLGLNNGETQFSVSGNQLKLTFTAAPVGTVTNVYTRTG